MFLSTQNTRVGRTAERLDSTGETRSRRSAEFRTALKSELRSSPVTRQPADKTSSTLKAASPTVVTSPFNPLGLAVQTKAAPTAAEVTANPEQFAGTSFDPSRGVTPLIARLRGLESENHGGEFQIAQPAWNTSEPPEKSKPTSDPNVFITSAGNSWVRPGAGPGNATTEDYDRWRLATFGPIAG